MNVVLMYGAGEGGRSGWPVQAADEATAGWTFLERLPATVEDPVPFDEPNRDARRIESALADGGHLIAHSGGAVAAMLAVERAGDRIHSLTLFEPACFSVGRGLPGVEAMVASMTSVFARADDPALSDAEFTHQFLLAMGTPGADVRDPESATVGQRLRLSTPPWETPLSLDALAGVPTLVVTGQWSAAFDEIAEVFVRAGGHEVVVPGTGHGPQYHPDGHEALTTFLRESSAAAPE